MDQTNNCESFTFYLLNFGSNSKIKSQVYMLGAYIVRLHFVVYI